ncbi:DEKNAAC102882 [Brettanomyces naardenensis]|uniref:DEKNAAC102882 n=1 Tax=Brettanomyces naardenensis TaxID=13370 RepID=A0A448YLT0_BRENA|nr:DEKNAAC102882 [Brettanomyces naardenensis]
MGPDALNHLPQGHLHKRTAQLTNPSVLENPRICKSFIVGKCPYDIFSGTKENFGRCPKIHQEKYKLLYEAARAKGIKMPRHDYELDYLRDLEIFINECNRKIEMAERRLRYTAEEKESLSNITREMDELDTRIALTTQEIQILSDKEDLDKAIDLSKSLKRYVHDRSELASTYSEMLENINQSAQQKLQVCTECGAYLSRLDNDKRLVDHFMGKIHLGYVEMRNIAREIRGRTE